MRRLIGSLALAVALAALAVAAPGDRTLRLVSTAGTNTDAFFAGASDDGARVFFTTAEALPATGDSDTARDVYERAAGGALRLVSTAGANTDASFAGASADGARAFFSTAEAVPDTGDSDTAQDVYERTGGGALRLVSTAGANTDASFEGSSADGARVFFSTTEALPDTGDSDTARDVYERAADGALRLVSTAGTNTDASFEGASADGARVFFATSETLPGTGDSDTAFDVYERAADGALRLVSTAGANTGAFFAGASADGARVFFATLEALPDTGDSDTAQDVYERAAGGALRLVSTGGANTNVFFESASADGARVFFATAEALPGTGDSDTALDVYERALGLPAPTAPPTVLGTPGVGATLTCALGTWAGEEISFARQWLRDGAPVAGATAEGYLVGAQDQGRALACRVSARNPIGAASTDSAAVGVPAPAPPPAPPPAGIQAPAQVSPPPAPARVALVGRPLVGGAPVLGTRLTCTGPRLEGTATFTRTWLRGGRPTGKVGATYLLTKADLGKQIACRVAAAGATAVSATSLARLIPTSCRVPALVGLTPAQARARLSAAGCKVSVLRVRRSGGAVGRALGSRPARAVVVPNGGEVVVQVRR